jgi:hypothetical protein
MRVRYNNETKVPYIEGISFRSLHKEHKLGLCVIDLDGLPCPFAVLLISPIQLHLQHPQYV